MTDEIVALLTGIGVLVAIGAVTVAIAANRITHRRAVMEDRKSALALHQELTSLEVQRAYESAPADPTAKAHLLALHGRAVATIGLLNDFETVAVSIQTILDTELEHLQMVDTVATQEVAVTSAAQRGMDRSAYTWDGTGLLTKHQALQKIAVQFAHDHQITTVAAFTSSFSAEVADALGDPGRPPDTGRLVMLAAEADASHQRVVDVVGPLVLDGRDYVLRHSVGYPSSDYARRTQIPLIESFVRRGYHVAPAG